MHVQKPTGVPDSKNTLDRTVKNVLTSKTLQSPVKSSVSTAVSAKTDAPSVRSIASLISSLRMPQDKLSASILSFARFFSLPLKPQMLADIRSQAFAQPSAEQLQSDSTKQANVGKTQDPEAVSKTRELFSLAASAAESKGVGLDNKGLESYAKAIDPDEQNDSASQGEQNSGEKDSKQRNKNNNEQKDDDKPLKISLIERKTALIDPVNLKKTALEYEEKNDLLSILNKLPGKNGQRWIVIPFEFNEDEKLFRVSMRVLLNTEYAHSSFMALDIVESRDHWLFVLESANNQVVRLSVYTKADLPVKIKAEYERELSKVVGLPIERITVKKHIDSFPFESGFGEELLNQIDEAV